LISNVNSNSMSVKISSFSEVEGLLDYFGHCRRERYFPLNFDLGHLIVDFEYFQKIDVQLHIRTDCCETRYCNIDTGIFELQFNGAGCLGNWVYCDNCSHCKPPTLFAVFTFISCRSYGRNVSSYLCMYCEAINHNFEVVLCTCTFLLRDCALNICFLNRILALTFVKFPLFYKPVSLFYCKSLTFLQQISSGTNSACFPIFVYIEINAADKQIVSFNVVYLCTSYYDKLYYPSDPPQISLQSLL
jgi:hypothetical protein